jgi:hypothetical protein
MENPLVVDLTDVLKNIFFVDIMQAV